MGQIVKVYKDGIGYQVLNTDNIGAALEAGDNISIDGNEISAVDTTYSAGTGLSLSGTTFSLNVDYGADLSLSIDPSTFVLTAQLKNQNGGNIGTAQTIDLPLESVVVSGSYNAQTKEVELTLQSGSVIRFSVADLVSGLQEELVVGDGINIDANNEISVDTSVIATKEYVDDNTSAVSGLTTTQPSNPSEGSIYYDSVNDVVKIYDGTNWIEVDTDTEYTAGTGIDIDANNEISVDTSVIATKEYVNNSIAESVSTGSTAPSNPTEGQLWYDTTNNILKTYDGTQWNEVGVESNTKAFYLSSTSDLTNAQAAYDWYAAGKNPIIIYNHFGLQTYLCDGQNGSLLQFRSIRTWIEEGNSLSNLYGYGINFTINNGSISDISPTAYSRCLPNVLQTGVDYSTPYTPEYDGSPATKKYVDDSISQAGGGDMLTTVYDPNGVGADAFDYTNFINTPTAGTGIDITNNTISVDNTIAKAADAGNVRRFENTTASLQEMYDWLYNSTGRYGIVQYNNRQDYIFGSTNATDGRVYSAEGYKVTNLSYSGKRLLLDKYNIYYTLNNGSVSGTLGYVSSGAFVGQDVAFAADVLTKTNTTAFTPTADYHPATKKYVDDSIAATKSTGTTAPSNPTEGQLWYDTTNDVLKVYDGTNWNAVNTDTTYSAGTGLTLNGTTFSADTTVLATKQDIADLGSFEVVASLPSVSSANTKTIYLLGPIGTGADKYEERIVTEDSQQQKQWTKIGETSMDLSGYATTSDLTSGLSTKQDTLTASTGINIDSSNNISNTLPGPTIASTAPTGTEGALWYDTTNDVLMAHDGTAWKEAGTQMKVLSYGHSTWQDFLDAYNENAIVYCRASSNSNPGTGTQGRMAFMAFVSINSGTGLPTEVEFQYYRSRSDHNTAANQLDQVFVYKLTSASGGTWTVTERNTGAKAVAGTGISLAFGSGNMTISADTTTLATQTDLNSKQDTLVSGTNIKTVNSNSLLGSGDITLNDVKISATAPSSPTEGMVWYDTTNDVLKSYNGSAWIEVGNDSADINTKAFYLSSTSDLTTAQAAYDWRNAGKTPIIIFDNLSYILFGSGTTTLYFHSTLTNLSSVNNSKHRIAYKYITLNISNNVVSSVVNDTTQVNFLSTDTNYSTPYTPTYNGSPATKKYVDDKSATVMTEEQYGQIASPTAGKIYFIKES